MANYKSTTAATLSLVGLATAVTCILGPIAIVLPFSPVPVSFGLLAVFLTTFLLKAKLGLLSCFIYLLSGFIGLPVFSGFIGGAGVLLGPTGGYLLGYLFIPLCTLPLCRYRNCSIKKMLPGICIGLILCYLCGTYWLGYQLSLSFSEAFAVGILPYILFDIIKLLISYSIANAVRKRLQKSGLYHI